MRVLVVANQRPLPTFHGANADIWRIMRALQMASVELGCVSWRDSIADDAYLRELEASVPDYLEFPLAYGRPIPDREKRRVPEFASLRRLAPADMDAALRFARRFDPDCILLMGLYGGELALQVAAHLQRPLVYRSHAIETQYHEEYFRLRRTSGVGNHPRSEGRDDRQQLRAMARFEQLIVARSVMTLEISAEDLHARRRNARLPIEHLPPLVSSPFDDVPPRRDAYDMCYVGNFFMPNNQQGISWFLRDVLPLVLSQTGPLRVVVAGKTMDIEFDRYVLDHGVDLTPNPANVDDIIAGSHVGVNPIFAGNGTTLKTLDYLWSGCATVTTPIGVQGFRFGDSSLPLAVATSATSFANAIVQQLGTRRPVMETRHKLRRFTWEDAGADLASVLRSVS